MAGTTVGPGGLRPNGGVAESVAPPSERNKWKNKITQGGRWREEEKTAVCRENGTGRVVGREASLSRAHPSQEESEREREKLKACSRQGAKQVQRP